MSAIDEMMLCPTMQDGAKVTVMVARSHHAATDNWPSLSELADLRGMSRSAIQGHVSDAAAHGYMKSPGDNSGRYEVTLGEKKHSMLQAAPNKSIAARKKAALMKSDAAAVGLVAAEAAASLDASTPARAAALMKKLAKDEKIEGADIESSPLGYLLRKYGAKTLEAMIRYYAGSYRRLAWGPFGTKTMIQYERILYARSSREALGSEPAATVVPLSKLV